MVASLPVAAGISDSRPAGPGGGLPDRESVARVRGGVARADGPCRRWKTLCRATGARAGRA